MKIGLNDLKFITPKTLYFCVKQFKEWEIEKDKLRFEAARISGYIALSAWFKEGSQVELSDIFPFPWDKKKEPKLTKVTIRKRDGS